MTGVELLKEKMIAKGASKQQTESKVIPIVLEVLAEEAGILDDTFKELQSEYRSVINRKNNIFAEAHAEAELFLNDAQKRYCKINERINKEQNEHLEFMRKLAEYPKIKDEVLGCASQTMKDRLIAAAYFKENANIRTAYDNTAYIHGLGAILAGKADEDGND